MSSPHRLARLSRVTFAYTDARPLFEDLDLTFAPGWTGLVGPNGAGKTTLLRLVANELPPTSGALSFTPERPLVLLCPQRVDALTQDIQRLSDDPPPHAHRLMGELGLWQGQLESWDHLSPGERKRWQVAAALSAEPDVLLLDEPTNHLDQDGKDLLLRALGRFKGVGIIVSHDRALLDALTTRTVSVEPHALRDYPGPYSAAKAAWDDERRALLDRQAQAQAAQRKARQSLHRARQALEAASANRSTGRRMKDKYDSDARSLLADYSAEQAEKSLARQKAALKRSEEKASAQVASIHVEAPLGADLFADYLPCPRAHLLKLEREDGLHAGEVRLLPGPLRLYVGRQDRLHLAGPNGAGKTTLLRALLESADGPLLYLPQELAASDQAEALRTLHALPRDVKGRVLSLVAALGVDPDHLLQSPAPSPGEARKLCLALAMGQGVWGLVLDEPTNHLDLPSVERLEALLQRWPGALVLVTHDADLASRTCTTRWAFEPGGLRTCT